MKKFGLMLLTFSLGGCVTSESPSHPLTISRTIVAKVDEVGSETNAAAYVMFNNKGEADRLISATCTCAEQVEFHHMVGVGETLEMRFEPYFEIPARAISALPPPGREWHIMLRNVRHPIPEGSTIQMELSFENAGTRIVEFVAVDGTRKAWDAMAD